MTLTPSSGMVWKDVPQSHGKSLFLQNNRVDLGRKAGSTPALAIRIGSMIQHEDHRLRPAFAKAWNTRQYQFTSIRLVLTNTEQTS